MKYILRFSFSGKPECKMCVISFNRGEYSYCAGLGIRPKCPEEGCRKDCPLQEAE